MQKQKTMAKWLAVALLIMVAIACYVALNAILKKDKPADTTAVATQTASDEKKPTEQAEIPQTETKLPVYSTFPRRAEQIDGKTIQHVGGEKDETYLASFTLDGRTLVFFSSSSTEYDQKSGGIHIAISENSYILSVAKIANTDEEYLSSILSKNGILFVTRSQTKTILRLISTDGEVTATAFFERFDSVKLTLDSATKNVLMFACDASLAYAYVIDDSLVATRSNFVFSMPDGKLEYLLNIGNNQLLFADMESGFEIISFSQNTGFTRKNRLMNCRFVQFEPNPSNTDYAFSLLLEKSDITKKSALVCNFDLSGNLMSSYLANGVENGVLKRDGDAILLFTPDSIYRFCSHLELVSKSKYAADDSLFVGDVRIFNLEGTDAFLRTDGTTVQVVDTKLNPLFAVKGKNLVCEYTSQPYTTSHATRFIFEAKANDALTYMAFGGYDVFIVDLTL